MADDWPQWRGPNRDGLSAETGLLQAWPQGGPPLYWRISGLGAGFSTVSVVGDRIYTAGDKDGAFCVHALGAKDGQNLWTTKVGKAGKMGGFPGPRSTPTVDGNVLFIIGQFGELVCLTSGYGVGCNLFEIQSVDGKLQAHQVYARRTIANHHGGVLLIGNYLYGYGDAKGWVCQEMASGQIKWAQKRQIGKGSLTHADGRFYLRAESGGLVGLIEASPEGYKETGRFIQPDLSKQHTWPHPVVANKRLYLRDQDNLFCYDVQAR